MTNEISENVPLTDNTCQQGNEHWAVAEVPEHEQFSSRDSASGNMTKQMRGNLSDSRVLLHTQE